MEKKNEITMEQFQEILDLLDPCMDDYLLNFPTCKAGGNA